MKAPRSFFALLAVIAVSAGASGTASAETVVRYDTAGREIHFDVQAPGVDVDWYASLLRKAAHGDEISTVTIRIVPTEQIHEECGRAAAGCYFGRRSPTLAVPAGKSNLIASILLHEYAHHLDRAWKVSGVAEPNGTPAWWALRGMSELQNTGTVSDDYGLGWDRGVGEIFAEDYAYIHVGGRYGIPWLYPPTAAMKRALLAELRGETTVTPPAGNVAKLTRPVTMSDSGTLAPGQTHARTFTLLGPGRRVTLTAAVSGRQSTGARALVSCDGTVVKSTPLKPGRSSVIDVPRLGPAECSASVVNTGATTQRFSFKLRLAIQV